MAVGQIAASLAHQWLIQGEALLIDVREPAEYLQQHIVGAMNFPAGVIRARDLPRDKKIIIYCLKGVRGERACTQLESEEGLDLYHLSGGLRSWVKQGFPVVEQISVWPVMQQAHLIIGLLLITFSGLSYFIDTRFMVVVALMGCGLTNAGLTGYCGLAQFLRRLSWNKDNY